MALSLDCKKIVEVYEIELESPTRNGARHRFADLGPPESCAERREPITGNRQHAVHRRFELEFPVSAVGLQPEKPDEGDVDGVLAVNSHESVGLEERRDLSDRPEIDEGCARAQTNFGLPSPGMQAVNVVRVEHPVFTAGDVDHDSMGNHRFFVA